MNLLHFFKSVFRSIINNRAFSVINISGLIIGLAVVIILFSWINAQLNFDRFHKDAKNLYLVVQQSEENGQIEDGNSTPAPLTGALQNQIPEIESATRIFYPQNRKTYKYADKSFIETFTMAVDPSFKDVFSFPLLEGNPETALQKPESVLITPKIAKKYFGDEDALGKNLLVDNKYLLTVTGIIKEAPLNSSIFFDFILPMNSKVITDEKVLSEWYPRDDFKTYVKLCKENRQEVVDAKIQHILQENISGSKDKLYLFPFVKLHTATNLVEDSGLDPKYIVMVSIVSIIILILICINYSNLSIANLLKRNKEIVLHKIAGASKQIILFRIFSESLIYIFISLPFAFLLCQFSMPFLNRFIGYEIFQGIQFKWGIIAGIFGITLLTGIISAIYPAIIFSRKKPAEVLALKQNKESNRIRNLLIVIQYAASIILIISTTVVFNQLHFMKNKDFGFNAEGLISVPLAMPVGEGLKGSSYDVFKDELLAQPGIVSVTRSLGSPMNNRANKEEIWWPGKTEGQLVQARWSSVDLDYIETLGVKLTDGQFFTYDMLSAMWNQEQTAFIVNRETVKQMGVESPVGFPIKLGDREGKIIGVTENFNYRTLYDKLEPLCMFFQPYFHFEMLIRVAPGHETESIDYIASAWDKYVPDFPFEYEFVLDNYRHQYETEDQTGKFLGVFDVVAVFIASIGLFGLALFSSEKRRKEIGIRKVNGARILEILALLNIGFVKWVAIAFVIATPVAWFAMSKWLENFAYKANLSWWIFALAGLLALGIALITVSWQSWRAATRNPVEALRYE